MFTLTFDAVVVALLAVFLGVVIVHPVVRLDLPLRGDWDAQHGILLVGFVLVVQGVAAAILLFWFETAVE